MNRRSFLKSSSLLSTALLLAQFPSWASSIFAWDQPLHNITADKRINPKWIEQLYKRGQKTRYYKSKNELQYIGMPVGGLHAGTVYAGGDGRLWLWQIYNETYEGIKEGIEPKLVQWYNGREYVNIRPRDGAAYIEPAIADNLRVLEQGFSVTISGNGNVQTRELRKEHWDEVIFESAYPSCKIIYLAEDSPLDIELHIYSPFIPLDAENSSLPMTTMHLKAKNKTKHKVQVAFCAWLENGVHKPRKEFKGVTKLAQVVSIENVQSILYSCEGVPQAEKLAGDYGTMALYCDAVDATANAMVDSWPFDPAQKKFGKESASVPFDQLQIGNIIVQREISPQSTDAVSYAISWHFNNPHPLLREKIKDAQQGYWYGTKFSDASDVLKYYHQHRDDLNKFTLTWVETWYNSTLPHWFLDRTLVNIGTLATANTYRFASGRFWAWEGVGACAGTCTHVWQYGQTMSRLFPELERNLRETTDLGVGFVPESGAIIFRAEYETRPAIDGQAGVILRFYREHQMSEDNGFLAHNWQKLKKAVQFIIDQDRNGDGMTDTPMENTLDAVWEGEIAWIVGLCLAAVKAAELMAIEMNDQVFQKTCAQYVSKGMTAMDTELFNGEYYIHRPNKEFGRKKLGSYNTCHIDQVYGQAWTFQVNLPRINSVEKTRSALKALWNYNFTMDVGPYIRTHLNGRPYALSGEGGMVMNTNPNNETAAYGEDITWQLGYFHECMSGFEHQVAAHMMAEGMVEESLILTRCIHERYDAAKRNPYNEIECSDHYARAMASYGTFINACGYQYHGPKKHLGFAPRMQHADFKAAFTAATGWGTYQQTQRSSFEAMISLTYGSLGLRTLSIGHLSKPPRQTKNLKIRLNGKAVQVSETEVIQQQLKLIFTNELTLQTGDKLNITWS
ncbi:GH116 family glycosyl hydrolase [Sphingobacterium sp. ML3W]|uniref:GH116 family glycosyl hydrolase n=1 Tax=Sphingobacterium sp. ML3W TaxID=1538644 RepID=UPI00249A162A|nr:GH116 family glycosyl hydrolase [Sphingobacterium sp. ML3W]WFA80295.1 GH116 family glycosyl hydrolase [Sphingobacterium sp. ML3W]